VDFIQEDRKADGSLYVILPEAMKPGATGELQIEYTGDKVVRKAGGGNFSVGARESWYPNVNTFRDHAVYDLTFRVPKRYTLVSVGNLEKAWAEKDVACTHWVSATPVAVAGFNYGEFKKKQIFDDTIHITLEGYAAATVPDYLREMAGDTPLSPSRMTDSALVEAQNAMRVYTQWFGKSAFSRIAITQQPEFSFGQSWPTLVYLPVSAFLDSTQRWQLMGHISNSLSAFVDEVTAHEVSHQWWGHMVGWESYRDQWLSEGFAEFSAGLYLQATEKNNGKYLEYWERARKRLTDKNSYGRRANDAGPLWMGLRLESFKNDDAYNAVVYSKGGYILHMLRSMMYSNKDGDKPFVDMMHDFVQQHLNRNATTESFQAVVQQHMTPVMDVAGNHRLDWFFRQWVYGTSIPRLKFEPTLTGAADGKCMLTATLTQSEVDANFVTLVPIYADFDGKVVRLGLSRVVGNTTNDKIQVILPSKPRRVMINAFHDILEL
jgi:aminopeptidase N